MAASRKTLRSIVIVLVVLICLVVGAGIALPGLLWQRDLGVDYSAADLDRARAKLNLPPEADGTPTAQYVEAELSDAEITALFNQIMPEDSPLEDVQIRINEDATAELFSKVDVQYLLAEMAEAGVSLEQLEQEQPLLNLLPEQANLYLCLSGNIADNTSALEIESATVQGIPVTGLLTAEQTDFISTAINQALSASYASDGTYINEISLEESALLFKGQLPSSLAGLEL